MEKNEKVRVPKQKRSKALTEQIINTAVELFSEHGYYSVTSHNIADAAGISIGSFYSYFSDKKQLMLTILTQYMEQVNQELPCEEELLAANDIASQELICQWLERILNAHRVQPGLDKQITILELDDAQVAEIVRSQEVKQVNFIERWLQLCVTDPGNHDLKAAAFVINNAIEKNIHDLAYSKSLIDESDVLHTLSEMISSYVQGLRSLN